MALPPRPNLSFLAITCLALATACSGGSNSAGTTPPAAQNTPPAADAGADQTVFETRTVTLSGTAVDPDSILTISWTQVRGPSVTLQNETSLSPTFLTPSITSDDSLIFELSVSDGVNPTVTDTVTINVRNVDPIGVASPPNPHVFPLMLALAEDDALPVTFFPITSGSQAAPLFDSGDADVLFVFTYIGAKQRLSGAIPDLKLVYPFMWRGFYEVTEVGVTNFTHLIGETVAVAGPVGTSENGGGGLIFRAAAKRQLVDPEVDLTVNYYQGIEAGSAAVASGEAAAIAVPAPATAGVIALGLSQGRSLEASIDYQAIFNGPTSFPDYPSIPEGFLPLGGAHATERALLTPGKHAAIELLLEVYADASTRLMTDPTSHASTTASTYAQYYEPIGAPPAPAPALTAAILNSALIYRSDIPVADIQTDLGTWITEILEQDPTLTETEPDAEFYETDFGPY